MTLIHQTWEDAAKSAVAENEKLRDRINKLEEKLEEKEGKIERLRWACDVFEKNSEACVEEYEGRLKAEKQLVKTQEDNTRLRNLMSDVCKANISLEALLCDQPSSKYFTAEMWQGLTELRDTVRSMLLEITQDKKENWHGERFSPDN